MPGLAGHDDTGHDENAHKAGLTTSLVLYKKGIICLIYRRCTIVQTPYQTGK